MKNWKPTRYEAYWVRDAREEASPNGARSTCPRPDSDFVNISQLSKVDKRELWARNRNNQAFVDLINDPFTEHMSNHEGFGADILVLKDLLK